MKACRGCGIAFTPAHGNQQFHSQACRNKANRATPERARAHAASSRAKPEVAERRRQDARMRSLARFGMTGEDYDRIFDRQGGGCAGCGFPGSEWRRLDIDHRHLLRDRQRTPAELRTQVRGLLCWRCNRALGLLRDSSTYLRRLADFLDEFERNGSAVDR